MATSTSPARYRYSYAEYLAYEHDSGMKHEYVDGEIIAMAGASVRHNVLAVRISTALENARKPGCFVVHADQRVRILATGRATYPDVAVVCGPIERDPADASGSSIVNPTLIVEVLSPSTEHVDRGDKWRDYQLIPALQEYVLVSQDARIEYYRRLPGGGWEYRDASEGAIALASGAVLELARLYEDLPE